VKKSQPKNNSAEPNKPVRQTPRNCCVATERLQQKEKQQTKRKGEENLGEVAAFSASFSFFGKPQDFVDDFHI
jgi:hypothetical protein